MYHVVGCFVNSSLSVCLCSLSLSLSLSLSQAQQGVQRRLFATLEELVEYYGHSRRGLVVGLTKPIPQQTQQDDHAEEQDEESGEQVT